VSELGASECEAGRPPCAEQHVGNEYLMWGNYCSSNVGYCQPSVCPLMR